jgi:hypothetical protein
MSFDIASISAGRSTRKPRTVVYGDSGLGKTTFGAGAPAPIFIQTEDGLGMLEVPHFPLAKNFDDVMGAIATLYTEPHDFQSLIVDSLDWLEPLIWSAACAAAGKTSIEDFGFGKGYVEALGYWRQFMDGITALRNDRDMFIILLAHSQIVHIEDPLTAAYDSHSLKLHKRAAALVEEFSDVIGFAALKTMTIDEKKQSFSDKDAKRTRAKTTGERQLHVSPSPAFAAKNRYNLPPVMPLEWASFAAAFAAPAVTA